MIKVVSFFSNTSSVWLYGFFTLLSKSAKRKSNRKKKKSQLTAVKSATKSHPRQVCDLRYETLLVHIVCATRWDLFFTLLREVLRSQEICKKKAHRELLSSIRTTLATFNISSPWETLCTDACIKEKNKKFYNGIAAVANDIHWWKAPFPVPTCKYVYNLSSSMVSMRLDEG